MTVASHTARPEPSSVRLALTLGAVGLAAGLALAGAYEFTLPRIEANKARALRQAVTRVVPGSTQMQELMMVDGALKLAPDGSKEPRVYAAYDGGGELRGFAIPSEGPGFQDTISLIYGYDPDERALTGMFVLQSRETPGLGDKIFKDAKWVASFEGLSVDPELVVVKDGADAANELDAITGATISSKAIAKIINAANATWLEALPKKADAPPLPTGIDAPREEGP